MLLRATLLLLLVIHSPYVARAESQGQVADESAVLATQPVLWSLPFPSSTARVQFHLSTSVPDSRDTVVFAAFEAPFVSVIRFMTEASTTEREVLTTVPTRVGGETVFAAPSSDNRPECPLRSLALMPVQGAPLTTLLVHTGGACIVSVSADPAAAAPVTVGTMRGKPTAAYSDLIQTWLVVDGSVLVLAEPHFPDKADYQLFWTRPTAAGAIDPWSAGAHPVMLPRMSLPTLRCVGPSTSATEPEGVSVCHFVSAQGSLQVVDTVLQSIASAPLPAEFLSMRTSFNASCCSVGHNPERTTAGDGTQQLLSVACDGVPAVATYLVDRREGNPVTVQQLSVVSDWGRGSGSTVLGAVSFFADTDTGAVPDATSVVLNVPAFRVAAVVLRHDDVVPSPGQPMPRQLQQVTLSVIDPSASSEQRLLGSVDIEHPGYFSTPCVRSARLRCIGRNMLVGALHGDAIVGGHDLVFGVNLTRPEDHDHAAVLELKTVWSAPSFTPVAFAQASFADLHFPTAVWTRNIVTPTLQEVRDPTNGKVVMALPPGGSPGNATPEFLALQPGNPDTSTLGTTVGANLVLMADNDAGEWRGVAVSAHVSVQRFLSPEEVIISLLPPTNPSPISPYHCLIAFNTSERSLSVVVLKNLRLLHRVHLPKGFTFSNSGPHWQFSSSTDRLLLWGSQTLQTPVGEALQSYNLIVGVSDGSIVFRDLSPPTWGWFDMLVPNEAGTTVLLLTNRHWKPLLRLISQVTGKIIKQEVPTGQLFAVCPLGSIYMSTTTTEGDRLIMSCRKALAVISLVTMEVTHQFATNGLHGTTGPLGPLNAQLSVPTFTRDETVSFCVAGDHQSGVATINATGQIVEWAAFPTTCDGRLVQSDRGYIYTATKAQNELYLVRINQSDAKDVAMVPLQMPTTLATRVPLVLDDVAQILVLPTTAAEWVAIDLVKGGLLWTTPMAAVPNGPAKVRRLGVPPLGVPYLGASLWQVTEASTVVQGATSVHGLSLYTGRTWWSANVAHRIADAAKDLTTNTMIANAASTPKLDCFTYAPDGSDLAPSYHIAAGSTLVTYGPDLVLLDVQRPSQLPSVNATPFASALYPIPSAPGSTSPGHPSNNGGDPRAHHMSQVGVAAGILGGLGIAGTVIVSAAVLWKRRGHQQRGLDYWADHEEPEPPTPASINRSLVPGDRRDASGIDTPREP